MQRPSNAATRCTHRLNVANILLLYVYKITGTPPPQPPDRVMAGMVWHDGLAGKCAVCAHFLCECARAAAYFYGGGAAGGGAAGGGGGQPTVLHIHV